ncbi:MAG: prohibitin family protein [Bacteroidetes bacterium]|nr:MAG: prohibitin family protein [Bacteroidota bacterium]
MKTICRNIAVGLLVLSLSSCVVVRPGEVGVRQKLGKIEDRALTEGPRSFNPLTSTIITLPIRTVNMEIRSNLPSKEGLTISTEISILYHLKASKAPDILRELGRNYESEVILPVFRSAAADVTARFLAKDLHSGERAIIEKAISDQMAGILDDRGIVIEAVLMKSIQLPQGLSRSIEQKLQAEQDAQRLEFVKQQEQREAERIIIKAEGEKRRIEIEAEGDANATLLAAEAEAEANRKLSESLTPEVLRFRAIDAFMQMSKSENAKVIITDNETPFLGLPAELAKDN